MLFLELSKKVDPIFIKLDSWFDLSISYVPNVLIAILLLVIFRFLAGYGGRLMANVLAKASQNEALVSLVSALTRIVILTTGLFFALGILGLEKTVTSMVAGAGVLALALGFAFQDLTTNFISGAFIAIQRPIKVGDIIETNGFTGKVKSINLRSVIIDNLAGQQVEIPSKDIFQKPITNFTHSGERRVQIDCGVGFTEDLALVEKISLEAMHSLGFLSATRSVDFSYVKFGASTIDFQVQFWIDQAKTGPGSAKSEAIKVLKTAFDIHGIVIPVKGSEVTPTEAKKDLT
ncbi:mechanosensitive ion channel family protein [Dyadobacter sp. LHD-138]|uniref:mechanosensitive ion channel family protein n=1 Tax=Dyadobacter sp. LHD-138 TaxID=3071413 RepID=UPI0027E0ECFF|nr:mechanosensitive ion channel family protein [Dyadobacter sp. LHD-138]MDQ6478937.1 mechanosensitive ion channel family protein [Dyadobacter sp. LHD-138]